MEESNPDLESFRQQWRAEVSARSKAGPSKAHAKEVVAQKPSRKQPRSSRFALQSFPNGEEHNKEGLSNTPTFQGGISHTGESSAGIEDAENVGNKGKSREPRSALEHYERAVEREAQGNLGDSLDLYRKAFRVC
jgi:F-box protein 9